MRKPSTQGRRGWMLLLLLLLTGCRIFQRRSDPPPPPPPPYRPLRLPPRGQPLTSFEQMARWTAASDSGHAEVIKTPERAIWGEYAGKLDFVPASPGPHRVVLTPDEPWLQRSPFDVLTLWVWDDGPPSLRPDHTIRLVARNAEGERVVFELPYQPRGRWEMLHLRQEGGFPWPLRFESLEWHLPHGQERSGRRSLYLEGLRAHAEGYGRIPRDIQFVRPHDYAPAFAPQRPDSVLLDLPPRPAAFRPLPPSERHQTRLLRETDQRFRFEYQSGSGTLGYVVDVSGGGPRIEVRVNEIPLGEVWRDLRMEVQGEAPEFRFSRIEGQVLVLQYTQGLRLQVNLSGRTLQLEAHALGEAIEALSLGRLAVPENWQGGPLFLPFLRVAEELRWPLLQFRSAQQGLFVSVIPDWWFSMAGFFDAGTRSGRGEETLGRMVYPPRWRGSRNVFRERIYFTVSPRLQDVLPGPAAVEALFRESLSDRVLSRRVYQESPTPLLLGLRPDSPEWQEDWLGRDPRGDWRPLEFPYFLLKSARFPDVALRRAVRGVRDLPPGALMIPEAGLPPWAWTDFDARVLGAGTFSQSWSEFMVLLQQVAAESGRPLLAPGGGEWLMAGGIAGFLPSFPLGFEALHPYLPQHVHQNILPYSALLGLGELEDFRLPGEEAHAERQLHRMLAAMVVYGAVNGLPDIPDRLLAERSRLLLSPLLSRFETSRVQRFAYWDGSRFLEGAEALHEAAYLRSRVYLRLSDGSEIWVNGDLFANWHLKVDGRDVELPPDGWVARGNGFEVLVGLNRHGDLFAAGRDGDRLWLDSPASASEFRGLQAQGFVRLRPSLPGLPARLETLRDTQSIQLSAAALGLQQIGSLQTLQGPPTLRPQWHEPVWIFPDLPADTVLQLHERGSSPDANFSP